jgi:hypothetical protein
MRQAFEKEPNSDWEEESAAVPADVPGEEERAAWNSISILIYRFGIFRSPCGETPMVSLAMCLTIWDIDAT